MAHLAFLPISLVFLSTAFPPAPENARALSRFGGSLNTEVKTIVVVSLARQCADFHRDERFDVTFEDYADGFASRRLTAEPFRSADDSRIASCNLFDRLDCPRKSLRETAIA